MGHLHLDTQRNGSSDAVLTAARHAGGCSASHSASTLPERPSTTSSNRARRPGVRSAIPGANVVERVAFARR